MQTRTSRTILALRSVIAALVIVTHCFAVTAVAGEQFAPQADESATAAPAGTGVFVNGREMSSQELRGLEAALGQSLPPGQYDMDNGESADQSQANASQRDDENSTVGEMVAAAILIGLLGAAMEDDGYGYESAPQGYGNQYGYGAESGDDSYMYTTPTGSGERSSDGSWSHHSEYGGGVAGDGNGCYYTAEWSNC